MRTRPTLAILALVVCLSSCERNASTGKTTPPSKTVTITGILKGESGALLTGNGFLLTVVLVKKEGEEKQGQREVEVESKGRMPLVSPDDNGRFTIVADRTWLPAGRKFMVVMGSLLSGGLQPVRVNNDPIVFELDDRTETVDLGTILVRGS